MAGLCVWNDLRLFGTATFFACAAGVWLEHLEIFGDLGPVDEVPEGVDVVWATVLVVEVVGVLPDIQAKDWFVSEHDGGVLVGGGADMEFAFGVEAEPRPAGAEAGGGLVGELFFEALEGAEGGIDALGEFAFWCPTAVW